MKIVYSSAARPHIHPNYNCNLEFREIVILCDENFEISVCDSVDVSRGDERQPVVID